MKYIKQIILVVIFGLITLSSYSQQDAQYTQYTYNMNILNPAYAGSQGTLSIGIMGRTQWVGFEGAPKTMTASIHAPIGKNVGLGLSVVSDEIGPIKEQSLYADFSYTLQTSEEGRLAFGIKGGISFQDINFLDLSRKQQSDPLLSNNLNELYPNFGVGVYYYTNNYYLGLSMPNILETRHFNKTNGIISSASERKHYFLTGGVVFEITDDLKLKPSAMIKAVTGSPVSFDLSVNALMYEKFEVGLSWRGDDSLSVMMNFLVAPNLRVGYAYDYTLTNLGDYNSGSHEVFILYNVDLSRGDAKSPRFF